LILLIDQLVGAHVTEAPLLSSTVARSRGALQAAAAITPTFERWTLAPGRPPPWRRIIKAIRHRSLDRKVTDFLWKILHRALPVGYNRRRFADPSCPHCDGTIDHLLVDCPVTREVWLWFSTQWDRVTGPTLNIINSLDLLLLISARPRRNPWLKTQQLALRVAAAETLYAVWLHRNDVLFNEATTSAPTAIGQARFRVRRALTTLAYTKDGSAMLANLTHQLTTT